MNTRQPFPYRRFLSPRYWPAWLGLGLLRLLILLPTGMQWQLGRLLGWLLRHVMTSRREVATTNLRLCFPELSEAERQQLLIDNFASLGFSLFETAMSWWAGEARIARLHRMDGVENVEAALAEGKGVLMLGAHFMTLDLAGRMLKQHTNVHVIYRPFKHPLFDALVRHYRTTCFGTAIERQDIRGILRSLKQNNPVWYAPDQDYGTRHSVFVKFFGIDTAVITVGSRLAKMSGAKVLYFFHQRLADGSYVIKCTPALDDFPSGDDMQDTQRLTDILEQEIRQYPEQYLWIHRRFKSRPPGVEPYYPRKFRIAHIHREEFEDILKDCKPLGGSAADSEHCLDSNGYVIRRFSSQRDFWPASPAAYRFFKKCIRLQTLGVPVVEVKTVFNCNELQQQLVQYPFIAGTSLCKILHESADPVTELGHLCQYVAMLHDKGIDCSALQLDDILVTPDNNYVLLEVSKLRFTSGSLSTLRRIGNLVQLFSNGKDAVLYSSVGVKRLVQQYLQHTSMSTFSAGMLKRFVK